ncbi:MAG TPA: antitoxin [Candidatus Dormibacteraeota bacterium]|jgi:hypothetical protein|nr:antitoxin [Candidatus Dormibacteraeota bacterium]
MLDHRLQILLDHERFEKLSKVAQIRGLSVAAVIREAIDRAVPSAEELVRRETALTALLAAPPIPVPDDPALVRHELDQAHDRLPVS